MAQKQIFIVTGSTGQYDDFTTWQVAAFDTLDQAEKYRDLAQAEGQRVIDMSEEDYYVMEPTCYDTQFKAIGRYMRYRVTPLVLFEGAFPENALFGVDPALLSSKPIEAAPVAGTFADKLKRALQPA